MIALRLAVVILLLAHGVAHLVGFLVPWRLAIPPEMPYRTTVLGGAFDLGSVGIRVYGLVWLVLGLAFAVAAGALALGSPWWFRLAVIAGAWSLVLCVAGWPESRIGIAANVVLLILTVAGAAAGWLPRAAG